jgi:hypothetical protein
MVLKSRENVYVDEIISSLDIIIHQARFAKKQIKNDMDLQTFQSSVAIEREILRIRERLQWRENHRKNLLEELSGDSDERPVKIREEGE